MQRQLLITAFKNFQKLITDQFTLMHVWKSDDDDDDDDDDDVISSSSYENMLKISH